MDLLVATLIIQDAHFATHRTADRRPAPAARRDGLFGLRRSR
jgi:hypothetical protein